MRRRRVKVPKFGISYLHQSLLQDPPPLAFPGTSPGQQTCLHRKRLWHDAGRGKWKEINS